MLKDNRIPQQTYDYVFMIFAAAVIGENPALFGFSFGDPLRQSTEPDVGVYPIEGMDRGGLGESARISWNRTPEAQPEGD